ncbi:periplasmic heavy metal sensor [Actibacterium lipolyticum]|uniref:Periplasmic heavy metal sensor n=1 Tax=Actibacterium lipolyticum TaxID=1524263 RepID=A0A238JR86_9RHOB|nr:periplasmic heavy metal sensor [Actibacterium lipolyticum]SMX33151.1 hypothetical protein COL8621_00968 [Actibacterium lipolyticum]
MSDLDTQKPRKRFTWGRALLGASLAMNLLVVGVVAGSILNHAKPPKSAPLPGGDIIGYGPYTQALTAEDRVVLRDAMKRKAPELRSNRKEVKRDFDRLLVTLRAQPFDRAAAEAILGAQHARVEGQVVLVRRLLMDHIEQMEPAERVAFAERLTDAIRRGPKSRKPARD